VADWSQHQLLHRAAEASGGAWVPSIMGIEIPEKPINMIAFSEDYTISGES